MAKENFVNARFCVMCGKKVSNNSAKSVLVDAGIPDYFRLVEFYCRICFYKKRV